MSSAVRTGEGAYSLPRVESVAVIGAGISGVSSAAHLLARGLKVTLFERSDTAGGVWHFDQRSSVDPPYPNEVPSRGDYDVYQQQQQQQQDGYPTPERTPSPRGELAESRGAVSVHDAALDIAAAAIVHAPPGPCYAGLQNNVSLTQMKTPLAERPVGLGDFVSQSYLEEYIQLISKTHGVDEITRYGTRVESVRKGADGGAWEVWTTALDRQGRIVEKFWHFDAVVVASGHYNMPRVPAIPGLVEWKAAYPEHVSHSKRYRNAAPFAGKTVLIIGAGVSSTDIAKEIAPIAKHVYQSSRGGRLDLPASMLPSNATRVGGVTRFGSTNPDNGQSPDGLSGVVKLVDASRLENVKHVILGTGYITSYPFLGHLHDDNAGLREAGPGTLVTREGDMVHNLHKDIFYIADPTLAFVGVPYHISTFSLFDFQAQVVARVYAGLADLPSRKNMRAEYEARLDSRGPGRDFHSLRADDEELGYVTDLVRWMNSDVRRKGVEEMAGHTAAFLIGYRAQRQRLKDLGRIFERKSVS